MSHERTIPTARCCLPSEKCFENSKKCKKLFRTSMKKKFLLIDSNITKMVINLR